jgi:hypothetical protein
MKKTIKLLDACGEFCTARTHPALPALRAELEACVDGGGDVLVDRQGLKSFTVSFLDELLGPLIARRSVAEITAKVAFHPPLEDFLAEQLHRSARLRTGF